MKLTPEQQEIFKKWIIKNIIITDYPIDIEEMSICEVVYNLINAIENNSTHIEHKTNNQRVEYIKELAKKYFGYFPEWLDIWILSEKDDY